MSNTDEALIIRDLDAPGCPSITNDAEAVVEYLALPSSKRLLYFDTNGDLDELVHDGGGKMLGFKLLPRPAAT